MWANGTQWPVLPNGLRAALTSSRIILTGKSSNGGWVLAGGPTVHISPGLLAVVGGEGALLSHPPRQREEPVHLSSIARFFDEAKRLADVVADGDVATLIDRGINALEREGLDGRRYAGAAQRAGHWEPRFGEGDWKLVRECADRLQANPAAAEAIVRESGRHRTPDMNADIYALSSLLGDDDDLALPEPGAAPGLMRVWAHRILAHIRHACEQTLKNYLGMVIAVGSDDPVAAYKETQEYTVGEFARANGTSDDMKALLNRVRPLRNADAHVDFTIKNRQILIRPRKGSDHEPWQPEEVEDAFKTLLRTLGAVSLGATIGVGPHYQASAAEEISEAAAAGSDLSLIEHLLTTWMEWSDVRASFHDGAIAVEARSAGPGPVRDSGHGFGAMQRLRGRRDSDLLRDTRRRRGRSAADGHRDAGPFTFRRPNTGRPRRGRADHARDVPKREDRRCPVLGRAAGRLRRDATVVLGPAVLGRPRRLWSCPVVRHQGRPRQLYPKALRPLGARSVLPLSRPC